MARISAEFPEVAMLKDAIATAATARPHVDVPVLGRVTLPSVDRLAFYGALGTLVALQLVEWPVALIIGIGHYLAEQHFSGVLRGIGEAAETA
ncbi:hypothetical protein [Sphaerisporangium aureirubrum]|uniref:Uncharacterized protein n=1 Tax=Sphaerisporangium aureirubrum TaxID=1544736 RepID=A0ABW1NPF4_9ACTN